MKKLKSIDSELGKISKLDLGNQLSVEVENKITDEIYYSLGNILLDQVFSTVKDDLRQSIKPFD